MIPWRISRRGQPPLRRGRGFTLIEILITLAIIGGLTALAAPAFNDAILSNKLAGYANSFIASAQLARGEAIKRNESVTLCRSSNGTSCAASGGWEQGWIVRTTGGTVLQQQPALSSDYHFTGDSYIVVFQPLGSGASAATLTLCRALPSPGSQEREIRVMATGRAAVTVRKTGVCS